MSFPDPPRGQGGSITNTMFSVIIPLYNKAPYVEKAIRSVAAQTFQEFELIVVDDGSTDLTAPQPPKGGAGLTYSDIEQLIDGKGILIKQKNSGVSVARNNGVAQAKYPYICFLDADDWWAPTFLEEMKALIDEFPDAGIYGTSYYKVKNGKHIPANIGVEEGFIKGEINYCQVYAKSLWMPLWTGAVCIPKTVFENEQGFKPALKLGEDFDLWIRIVLKHKVVLLNKPLAYYNQDVEIQDRAIGPRLYKPEEHMLFTDYGELMENEDFKYLFERLSLYSLLPYFLKSVNIKEVNLILKEIQNWKRHDFKYQMYYKYLPKKIVSLYFEFLKKMVFVKNRFLK